MIICAVASFFPGINAGHVKLRFLVRFQLETLREDIVQSLSVLGRLEGAGGVMFGFWRGGVLVTARSILVFLDISVKN